MDNTNSVDPNQKPLIDTQKYQEILDKYSQQLSTQPQTTEPLQPVNPESESTANPSSVDLPPAGPGSQTNMDITATVNQSVPVSDSYSSLPPAPDLSDSASPTPPDQPIMAQPMSDSSPDQPALNLNLSLPPTDNLNLTTSEPVLPPSLDQTDAVAQLPPVPEAPLLPAGSDALSETNPGPTDQPSPSAPGRLFKIIFAFSFLLFAGVSLALGYIMIKKAALPLPPSETDNVNLPADLVDGALPTQPSDRGQCLLSEDQKYNINQTFPAADGCNTCTCQEDLTIICTQDDCFIDEVESKSKESVSSPDSPDSNLPVEE